jgi:hypothetical protein
MFRANVCPSSGAQDWDFYNIWYVLQPPSYRTRSAKQHAQKPCLPHQQDFIPYVVKISVLRSWRWAKVCPKHVDLILEINKTVIVASSWCSIFTLPKELLTYQNLQWCVTSFVWFLLREWTMSTKFFEKINKCTSVYECSVSKWLLCNEITFKHSIVFFF